MRSLHAFQLTLVFAPLGGCLAHATSTSKPHASSPLQATQPAAVSGEPATPPAPAAAYELIVGSERGLEAWLPDGASKRMISPGSALQPRWLDSDTLLVLHPSADTAEVVLERVSLRDGARSSVAQLPAFSCVRAGEAQSYPIALKVQSFSDFVVDRRKQLACIARMDRNYNMAEVRLTTHVDLRTSAASSWLELAADSCQPPEGVSTGDPPEDSECGDAAAREPESEAHYPYAFDEGTLWELGEGEERVAKLILADYYPERSSRSGRWVVLSGDEEEGDYLYRRVVLLDRSRGEIFAIPEQAGGTFQPLTAADGEPPRIATPLTQTSLITGETDVEWLPPHDDTELLLLGAQIIIPGQRSFAIDGELAR